MIRQPSSWADLHRWWNDAIAGRDPERHPDDPECGFYRTRLVKGGPWVPVHISVEREIDIETGELAGPERLVATVEGLPRDPFEIWSFCDPIPANVFWALVERHRSDDRMAATRVQMDLSETPILPPMRMMR